MGKPDAVAELIAKALYEQQMDGCGKTRPRWARRDTLFCALTMIDALRRSQVIPEALLAYLPKAPLS